MDSSPSVPVDGHRSPTEVMLHYQFPARDYFAAILLCFAVSGCGPLHGYSVEQWWRRVIEVDPDTFTDIKHFTLQGIDYSHHFRFAFTDRSDIDAIIRKHGLTADSNPIRFSSDSLPRWFEPPEDADAFSNGDQDPSIVIWIDDENRVAYFELVKI
jgi:hypothetical protein